MSTAWGINPIDEQQIVNGTPTTVKKGTTDEDVRLIWGSLYSPGVINGCTITLSSTDMTYTISPGVAAIHTAGQTSGFMRECVMAPVPYSVVLVPPTSGAVRTDYIYARQYMPGPSLNQNEVEVSYATSASGVPANAQLLGVMRVPANSTTTAGATMVGTVDYSIPYASNLGVFWANTDTSNAPLPKTSRVGASGSVSIPTDRKVLITLDACLSALRPDGSNAYLFDNSAYCEAHFTVYVDDVQRFKWRSNGLHQAWQSIHFEEFWNLNAGPHTISYRTTTVGVGTVDRHHAGADLATGITFAVRDAGLNESNN